MITEIEAYRALQQHLDKMPVGYPVTQSGVEINLLKTIFTPQEAVIATHLDYKHKPLDEIFETAHAEMESIAELENILDNIVAKGGISRRTTDAGNEYAVLPLVLWGMYEHQIRRLSPDFLMNFGQYIQNEFGYELASSPVPKMRVIPIEESVEPEHNVATYDELRHLIAQSGESIAIQPCICRTVADLQGRHCQATERREVCMSLGDLADLYIAEGWGRQISPEEALEIARQSEAEGLVLMPGNQQEAEFICACCPDCCGMLSIVKNFPRPADVVASNFFAKVDADLCTGVGTCVERCPLDAVQLVEAIAQVELGRCIGCGLCVPTCPEDAIYLVQKPQAFVPPETEEDYYDLILATKGASFPA